MTASGRVFDIITIGDMCVDLIVSGEDVVPRFGQVEKLVGDYILEMGGSCNIFACQAANLGLRIAIMGRVGDDSFGRLVITRLEECGVDTRFVEVDPALKTGLGIALCQDGDRAILTYMGTINAVLPEMVTNEFLSSAHHLHHASYYLHHQLRPAMPDIFRRARTLGLTLSIDTNWDPDERWDGIDELLPLTDVFLPNEQETVYISGQPRLEEAIATLRLKTSAVLAIKQGEKGALAIAGDQRYTCAVEPATSGGDSVGAGDSFDAGYLYGWLKGLTQQECLEIGCYCGRAVASAAGGLAGQPRDLPGTYASI
jgi:ribokinase